MTDSDKTDFGDLLGDFDLARQEAHDLPPTLVDRILADAMIVQDDLTRVNTTDNATAGLLERVRFALGGWPGFGGLVTAGLMGVWLGFAPPPILPDPFEMAGLTTTDLDMFDAGNLALALSDFATDDVSE